MPAAGARKEWAWPKRPAPRTPSSPVAKMKTHDATAVSLSMKNLTGLLHEYDMLHFHHVNVERVRGRSGCDGEAGVVHHRRAGRDGHVGAGPVEMGCLIAGIDPVAVDATASRAIGVDPAASTPGTLAESHIKRANDRGLGEIDDIEVIGDLPQRSVRVSAEQVSEISLPEGIEIIDGDPCAGVRGHAEQRAAEDSSRPTSRERPTILVGPNAPPPEQTKGRTIIIGNCLHRLASETQGSQFVIGCPPNGDYDVLPVWRLDGRRVRVTTDERAARLEDQMDLFTGRTWAWPRSESRTGSTGPARMRRPT